MSFALHIGVAIGFLIFTVFMTGVVGEDYVINHLWRIVKR